MKNIMVEVGKHQDRNPQATYVLQLIKFYDCRFDSGTVVKEFVLEKGQTRITTINVR